MLPANERSLNVLMSYEGYATAGSILGSASFIVIPDRVCVRLWREYRAENKQKSGYTGGPLPQ